MFGFSNLAALDVIEIGSKIAEFNPLKIIDPISKRNYMTHAANLGNEKLLKKLIELFPQEFLSIGQEMIAELLTQRHSKYLVSDVVEQFKNLGGLLDHYHAQLMDSHRKVMIDLSVEMAREVPEGIKEHQIYDTYPAMMTHLLDADGRYGKLDLQKLPIKVDSKDPSSLLQLFRYDRFGIAAHDFLPLEKGQAKLKQIMPRKPVFLPSVQVW